MKTTTETKKKSTKTTKTAPKTRKTVAKTTKKPTKTAVKRKTTTTKTKNAKISVKKPTKTAPKSKKSYKYEKERARNLAIDWQCSFAKGNKSYGEIIEAQEMFEKLGKKYGLTREFKENGII